MEALLGVSQTPFVLRSGQNKWADFFILHRCWVKNTGAGSWVVCGVEMGLEGAVGVFAEPRGTVGITMARDWSLVVEPDCLCCPVSTVRWERKAAMCSAWE